MPLKKKILRVPIKDKASGKKKPKAAAKPVLGAAKVSSK